MLIKIAVNAAARRDVLDIASIFRARAIDVSDHTITLEVNLFLFIHLSGFILKNAVIRNMVQNYMSIPSTKPKNNIGVYAEILCLSITIQFPLDGFSLSSSSTCHLKLIKFVDSNIS